MNKNKRTALQSISDSLAALFLQKSIEKGCGLEIPSLGIKIEGKKEKEEKKKDV